MAFRRFGRPSSPAVGAVVIVPLIVLAMLLIFYIMARTVERPAELSIARSDQQGNSASQPAPQTQTSVPVLPIVLLGGGLLISVVIIMAMNSKSRKPDLSPAPRRSPAYHPTPAPGPRSEAPTARPPTTNGEMMECPQCAEPIKRKALVCRFCGFKLESFVDRSKSFSSDDPGRTEAAE